MLLATSAGSTWAQDGFGNNTLRVPPGGAVAVVVPPAAPKVAKASGMAELIKGQFPLTLRVDELDYRWRELSVYGATYFTRGDTAFINDDEYLIAYISEPEARVLLQPEEYADAQSPGSAYRLSTSSMLRLQPIKMQSVIAASDARGGKILPFNSKLYRDAKADERAPDAYYQQLAVVYLRKINDALTTYSYDHLGVLPPMPTADAARQALLPYAENATIFFEPGTTRLFKANALLSGRNRTHLRKRSSLVVFYEAQPAADGMRAILQLNGRVRRVDAKTWRSLAELSGLE